MKRWHHKSRSGCTRCRERRVKCDEQRPTCRNCIRAESAHSCVYRQNPTSAAGSASPARLPPTPSAPVPFSHRELELMHHFCISTSGAIDDEPSVASWMREVAPSLLVSHPDLVGGLLGLTAAHMSFVRPYDKEKYIPLSYQHLNHALVQSQSVLTRLDTQIDAETAGALCLTAIFTSLTIQALPVVDSNQNHMKALERFITNFQAFRGISVVFWACSIHGKGFNQSYLPPNGGGTLALSDEESLVILDDLFLLIRENGENCSTQDDVARHNMYCAIFDELRNYVRARTIRQMSTVITGSTPGQWNMFCRLLNEGDIVCSLIGLCYTVAYHGFDRKWFMDGLQHRVCETLSDRVTSMGAAQAKIAEWARRRTRPYDPLADVLRERGQSETVQTNPTSRCGTSSNATPSGKDTSSSEDMLGEDEAVKTKGTPRRNGLLTT